MKTTSSIAVAALAAGASASWVDTPVDPITTTTTTPVWSDVPVKPTTTSDPATWVDYTTTSSKPVDDTTTVYGTWEDVSSTTKPVDPTHTWEDVPSDETTTTVWEETPVAPADPTHTWVDAPAPVDPTTTWADAPVAECSVKVITVTASTYVWVPTPAAAETWTDYPVDPTSTSSVWSDYPVDPTSTSSVWSDYPVDPTSTSSAWSDYVVPTTTTTKAWTKPATTTQAYTKPTTMSTKTTTTAAPKPTGGVCPNDSGKTLKQGGSCGCDFQINCGVKASPDQTKAKFWQRTTGEKIPTLAACMKICDENALCESVLFVTGSGTADDNICWQTSNLGPVTGTGYAQISYKGQCSGKCSASYTKQ